MMLCPRIAISPTSPCGTLVACVVDHAHLDALDRGADRAGLALAVGVVERRHRRGLGQPVALEHDAVERVLELAQHLDRHRRTTGHAHPQRRHVVVGAVGHVQQRAVHRRDAGEHRRVVIDKHPQRLRRVEPREHREAWPRPQRSCSGCRSARTSGTAADPPKITSSGLSWTSRGRVTSALLIRLAWVSSAPFGLPGCARGVEDHRGVVVGPVRQPGRPASRSRAGCRTWPGRPRSPRRQPPSRRPRLQRRPPCQAKITRRAGVAQVVGDLAGLEQRVHRHHDAARPQHAEVDDGELRDVGQHEPDPVARPEVTGREQAGDASARVVEVAIGEGVLGEADRHPIGVSSRGAGEAVGKVHGGSPSAERTELTRQSSGRRGLDHDGRKHQCLRPLVVPAHSRADLSSRP